MRFVFLTMAACLAAPSVLATPQPVEALRPVEDLLAEVDAAVEAREEPGFGGFLGTGHEFAQDGKPVVRAGSAAAWIAGWRVAAAEGNPGATERQLRALPGPADWPALRAEAAGDETLAVLTAKLAGDDEAAAAALASVRETEGLEDALAAARATLSDAEPLAGFEAELEAAEDDPGSSWLSVPDLVSLAGEEAARPLLRRVLSAAGLQGSWYSAGEATQRLARVLIAEDPASVRSIDWDVLDSLDAVEAWEALARDGRLNEPAPRPGFVARLLGAEDPGLGSGRERDVEGESEAWAWYVGGLVAAGRVDDAREQLKRGPPAGEGFAAGTPYSLLAVLAQRGHAEAVADVLDGLLAEDPMLPLWRLYREAAVTANRSDRLIERLEAALAGTAGERAADLRRELALTRMAVAKDRDAALAAFGVWLALPPGPEESRFDKALAALAAGRALDDAPTAAAGRAMLRGLVDGGDDLGSHWGGNPAVPLLLAGERTAEALRLAEDLALADLTATARDRPYQLADNAADAMEALLRVRVAAGDAGAALALLREGELWGVRDAAERFASSSEGQAGLGVVVAEALRATGEDAAAARVAAAAVRATPGSDAAYAELLATRTRDEALAALDAMAAADAYEERPLIWRAKLLLDGGDAEAAAAVAREAIAIDPSDGEQPAGDRMRVYAVLADALAAQGEDDDAELYRGVVRAIRASEDADLLYEAGFLALSIRGYETSLLDFSDAYCIQSRLAVRLMEAGRVDEAAEHHRRAFELMPDSFGRVESHCFGCEGAFRGAVAQGVAEKVFERLARERPDDAQVPYLVGYLAEERGDLEAARAGYRAAVDLDPLYLNAWKNLFELGERMRLPEGEEDEALLALLRLDPLGRHARGDTDLAQNLAALWEALEQAAAVAAAQEPDGPVFPLPAAAAALDAPDGLGPVSSWRWDRNGRDGPGEAIAEHPIGQLTARLAERQD